VGVKAAEDDGEPFVEKMQRLTAKLGEQLRESAWLWPWDHEILPSQIAVISLNNSTLLYTFSPSETSPSFRECLYFSAISLTGSTPVGLSPVGAWKYAVMFEGVLGYLFLALFIVVLARKLIR
jgi:hypothetical protein